MPYNWAILFVCSRFFWLRFALLVSSTQLNVLVSLFEMPYSRVSRAFKITRKAESELDRETFVRLASTKSNRNIFRAIASSAQSMLSGRTSKSACRFIRFHFHLLSVSGYDYHSALDEDVNDMKDMGKCL